jgi:hypothetical protein
LRQIKLDANPPGNVKALHMNWHDKKKRGYHHGNLREALVNAALDLIGSKGHWRLHLCRGRAPCRGQPCRALSPL